MAAWAWAFFPLCNQFLSDNYVVPLLRGFAAGIAVSAGSLVSVLRLPFACAGFGVLLGFTALTNPVMAGIFPSCLDGFGFACGGSTSGHGAL